MIDRRQINDLVRAEFHKADWKTYTREKDLLYFGGLDGQNGGKIGR
jgi:hypothetical protein